jgi:hypothetical protein
VAPQVSTLQRRIAVPNLKVLAAFLMFVAVNILFGAHTPASDPTSCEQEKKAVQKNMEVFDDLDFNVFSNQKWQELHKSHAKDIVVHWPDGRITKGIEPHIEDLKYMFTYAPDTRIKEHPIKIGQTDWTAVMGVMEGTFTKPMKTPDGKTIQPTGKKFKITMSTLGHWKDGVMIEEYLFWDNQTYMKQIGLAK